MFSSHLRQVCCILSEDAFDCYAPQVPHVPWWDITLTEGALGNKAAPGSELPRD